MDIFNPEVSYLGWMALVGVLALTLALASSQLRRLPVSTSSLYLGLGLVLGPLGLGFLQIEFTAESGWLERVTELAVIISLFIGGLKLRLPFRAPEWRAVPRLAGPVMLICILGVFAFAHFVLQIEPAAALLLGAVLAPTDPVLAAAVSVNGAKDADRMRYGLSGEAGLNDGMAFPFVVFALSWSEHGELGSWVGSWLGVRVLWAVPAALVFGYLLGKYVGRLAVRLRSRSRDASAPNDFLALALIALSYALAESVEAWGFLCVFAAGVGLRAAEAATVRSSPHPEADPAEAAGPGGHPPAEDMVAHKSSADALEQPAIAVGRMVAETLSFGDTAERILELMLVLIVGASLSSHWDARALPVAVVLFVALRPVSTWLLLRGTPTTPAQQWLMGWFGIRGIGSLYYLAHALGQAGGEAARAISDIALSVVALSIVVHGVSSRPLLRRYERAIARVARSSEGGAAPAPAPALSDLP